jgi:tetratricopeptide (TPR) repeat protein
LSAATADLTAAVRLKPQDYQAHVNLARAYQLSRQDDAAVRELDRAIELSPPSALAALYRTRARLHQEASRLPEAVRDLDEAARHESGGKSSAQAAEDLLAKGRLLSQARDYKGAVAAFDAALTALPDHQAALRARAEALLRLQRDDDALRDLNRLLEIERGRQSGAAPLFRVRAGIRAKAGDYQGAIEDYTHVLGLESDHTAFAARGWAFLALDSPVLAQTDFDRAVRLNPKDGDAHNGLAYARVKLGRYQDAVLNAEEALRLGPTSARTAYNAARVFAQASLKAGEDKSLPNARGRELCLAYQERAVALLREALAALPVGEKNAYWSSQIRRDSALNPIRTCKGFGSLAAEFVAELPDR